MKYHIYFCKFQNKKPNFTSFIKGIRDTEDLIAKKGQTFCPLQKMQVWFLTLLLFFLFVFLFLDLLFFTPFFRLMLNLKWLLTVGSIVRIATVLNT